jgi:hypothetical protein
MNLYNSNTALAQAAYQELQRTHSINQAMNSFISAKGLQDSKDMWTTLSLAVNDSFVTGIAQPNLAISNYLQAPLSNLVADYQPTDFSFPAQLDAASPPLTAVEQQFHTFIANALYSVLPSLHAMKSDLDYKTEWKLRWAPIVMRSFVTVVEVALIVMLVLTIRYKRRVIRSQNVVFALIQQLPPLQIEAKLRNCQEFSRRYCLIVEEISPSEEGSSIEASKNASKISEAEFMGSAKRSENPQN